MCLFIVRQKPTTEEKSPRQLNYNYGERIFVKEKSADNEHSAHTSAWRDVYRKKKQRERIFASFSGWVTLSESQIRCEGGCGKEGNIATTGIKDMKIIM